jgi:hypothetical protein
MYKVPITYHTFFPPWQVNPNCPGRYEATQLIYPL